MKFQRQSKILELIEKEKDLTKIAEFVAECEANGTTSDGFRP